MSTGFEDRLDEIERRYGPERRGVELTAVQRIELERSGGDRRETAERRIAEIRGKSTR